MIAGDQLRYFDALALASIKPLLTGFQRADIVVEVIDIYDDDTSVKSAERGPLRICNHNTAQSWHKLSWQ